MICLFIRLFYHLFGCYAVLSLCGIALELYQQTNARLWRQGQTETVIIQHIMVRQSIDEKVMKALTGKDASQERLIAAVKASIDDVRANQIRD